MTATEMILHVLIGFPLALLFCNATEWVVHRFVLHGLGKRKDTYWAFHWHDHYRVSRKQDMLDDWGVTRPWFDHLLGTRVKYLGTERETAARARAARREQPIGA